MKHSIGLLLCLFLSFQLFAQHPLQVSPKQLLFNATNELQTDSLEITIKNTSQRNLRIDGFLFNEIYGDLAFSVSDSSLYILSNDSAKVWIYFEPIQNVFYNTEMVILNNSNRGLIAIDLLGQGTFSKTYYSSTQNLEGDALKNALTTRLIQGATNLGYNSARNRMFEDIDNQRVNGQGAAQNTLECPYSARVISGFTNRSNAQQSPYNFNTEHTYPQSRFGSQDPMRSDIHHIFPTDAPSNSERGSKPFAELSSWTWTMGGSRSNNSGFEPRDAHKGTCARAMLYFGLRYRQTAGVDITFLSGQENVLKSWHKRFPPDQIDERRNDDIFSFQGNRNPFVDYPQLIERMKNIAIADPVNNLFQLEIPDTAINFGNVKLNESATYEYVLVNSGNQTLNISNLVLSNSDFQFASGFGNDTSILAGESLIIKIEYPNSDAVIHQANFTFQSNDPSLSMNQIPVLANPNVGIPIEFIDSKITLFPNPSNDFIFIKSEDFDLNPNEILILNALGQELKIKLETQNPKLFKINLEEFNSGIYFFKANSIYKSFVIY